MTVGDEQEVECPSCGYMMCIQDVTTDGCLRPGFVDVCPKCEKRWEIDSVDYSATVWVKRHEPKVKL